MRLFCSDYFAFETYLLIAAAGDGITRLSCHPLIQFAGDIRGREFKLLGIYLGLTVRT